MIPSFPECHPTIKETGIVLDLLELFNSARRPGGYFLLNCTCGDPSDVDIKDMVFVSHPDIDTVIWELDVHGLGPALEECWSLHHGFLRLVFKREEYEADLRTMLRDVRSAGSPDLSVEELDPGGCAAYEWAMALHCDEPWLQEPVLPAGTRLEFGLFGTDLLIIDGKPDRGWPVRLFTRWSAQAAFKQWIGYVTRGYAIRYELGEEEMSSLNLAWFSAPERRNNFFLLRESERADCDEAGAALVRTLQSCFAEGVTAPDVEVWYRACRSPAILSEVVRTYT
ncbi:MAG TPA: hypothetical protein P5102_02665 [Candidatus Competibacteraceae bacterium]|nr:hypothetical protein [Candidatus Competibacteraceae bacterium]HRZ05048.1 hypothetical protein [Candidatus Competibacteraceae bacterium]HSA45665.1 hypothetical protein [Candidatus Competibacteraceae bacterium]